jgi:hypothetical protein
MPQHILAAGEGDADPAPQPTGIALLAIGSTFVLGAASGGGA